MSSRLRQSSCAPDYDQQAIVHHIENVERRIRIMCRVSQVFNNNSGGMLATIAEDYEDAAAWNEVFYEFVDRQMDELKALRGHLERGFGWISIDGLRDGADFRKDGGRDT